MGPKGWKLFSSMTEEPHTIDELSKIIGGRKAGGSVRQHVAWMEFIENPALVKGYRDERPFRWGLTAAGKRKQSTLRVR